MQFTENYTKITESTYAQTKVWKCVPPASGSSSESAASSVNWVTVSDTDVSLPAERRLNFQLN